MIADILRDTIKAHLGLTTLSSKGWSQRNCMLCHTQGEGADKRGRFGIRFEPDGMIILNCFNCGYDCIWAPGQEISHKFTIFLRELGIPQKDIQRLVFVAYNEKCKLQPATEVKLQGSVFSKWLSQEFPADTKSLQEWLDLGCDDRNLLKVVEYALMRNFTRIDQLYWTPSFELQFKKRLLLPFYYDNKLVGYTGRWYGTPPSSKVPKYINQMPDSYIYNLDRQKSHGRKYVILIEGVFDAWVTDGISPINNTLSPGQIDMINSLGKEVIVCPDRDSAGKDFIKVALAQGWAVAFPNWRSGIKDAAKAAETYGRILTVQSILESSEHNKMKIELKWRLNKREWDR